jgi:hypothetical protein
MEQDHRPLEFPFQVAVRVEPHSKQEVMAHQAEAELIIRPMVVRELLDKDLLEESHRVEVEAAVVVVRAKLEIQMAKVMEETAR